MKPFRRYSWPVTIGSVTIGSGFPIAVQSMTNTPTLDTEASAAQVERIANAGGDIIRLTAQTTAHARNLANIKKVVRDHGVTTPLVADIHFTPEAAFAAAEIVEKVRINPGNFVDSARTFRQLQYTEEEYKQELQKIEDKLVPLIDICKRHGTALRIGVNHGSLSDRIMSHYGNTPAGMTESAMEFLRVCHKQGFDNVVISIKASNVCVMVETVRTLVTAMDAEDLHYPLHLGVTEAGDGEDGRVKSAIGIGALLADGIGDTIRVSLSEAPEEEIPVGRKLVEHFAKMAQYPIDFKTAPGYDNVAPLRRETSLKGFPVVGLDIEPSQISADAKIVTATTPNAPAEMKAQVHALVAKGDTSPVVLKLSYDKDKTLDDITLEAAADLGAVLLAGFGDAIWIDAPHIPQEKLNSLSLSILQAVRLRISKTEYIACPSCGRTLFDLTTALAEVKAATAHLPGLKIAVMGCIVNGPGEMADADYGYVGAGKGNVSLYKGKECMVKNIPAAEALPRLLALIEQYGYQKQ